MTNPSSPPKSPPKNRGGKNHQHGSNKGNKKNRKGENGNSHQKNHSHKRNRGGGKTKNNRPRTPLVDTEPGSEHHVDLHCWKCRTLLLHHDDVWKIRKNDFWTHHRDLPEGRIISTDPSVPTPTPSAQPDLLTRRHLIIGDQERKNKHKGNRPYFAFYCKKCGKKHVKGHYYPQYFPGIDKWKFFYSNRYTFYLGHSILEGISSVNEALKKHQKREPDGKPVPFNQKSSKETLEKVAKRENVTLSKDEIDKLKFMPGSLNIMENLARKVRASVKEETKEKLENIKKELEDLKKEVAEATNSRMDSDTRGKMEDLKKELGEDDEVPDFYCCPITSEIMKEPVMGKDGHTYEKEAILMWLEKRGTSPFTDEPLSREDLFPNYNLKKAIDSFARQYIPNWNEMIEAVHQKQSQSEDSSKKSGLEFGEDECEKIDPSNWEPEKKKQQ